MKDENVTLNKPMRGDVKKYKVYVKDPKTGNVKKVNFGDKNMEIKRDDPARQKAYRARHGCDNPGPKTKANYWSCKMWSNRRVTDILKDGLDPKTVTFKEFLTEKKLLDKPTMSPEQLAAHHKVDLKDIQAQLAKGMKVESEHTSDKAVAREIALDHIKEDPKYYDKLATVEK